MHSRRNSQNKRIFRLKELDIYAPNKNGLKAIIEIMEAHEIPYNCELYSVTKWVERYYPRIREQEKLGIHLTSEVSNCVNYIKENDLLKKGAR